MLAEILEQSDVYLETMRRASSWRLPAAGISSIVAIGSGASFNVALLARHYLEDIAGIPTRVSAASEAFRYETPHPERTLAIALSHSGRSRDVRAAVARAKRQGVRTLAITNIEISPLTRDAERAFVTGAGAKLAVPSTKGFTALIAAVLLLASSPKNGPKKVGAARLVGKASSFRSRRRHFRGGQGRHFPRRRCSLSHSTRWRLETSRGHLSSGARLPASRTAPRPNRARRFRGRGRRLGDGLSGRARGGTQAGRHSNLARLEHDSTVPENRPTARLRAAAAAACARCRETPRSVH